MPLRQPISTRVNDSSRERRLYRGEAPQTGYLTAQRVYASSSAPASSNDSRDTAGIGVVFKAGDVWVRSGVTFFVCIDDTASSAVWKDVTSETVLEDATAAVTLSPSATFYSLSYTTTGAVAVTLPSASSNIGITYTISDSGANASANNITVSRAGTDTIITDSLAQTTVTIATDGAVLRFTAINSTTWKVW